MATADTASKSQDKVSRLKPFAWMKRLASRKTSSSDRDRSPSKKARNLSPSKSKASPPKGNGQLTARDKELAVAASSSDEQHQNGSYPSLPRTADEDPAARAENKSIAPTLQTNPGTIHSDSDHHSKAGTSNTIGGGMSSASGGANSIFSSSNHSSHSLTTTLTTIQSAAPGNAQTPQLSQGVASPHQTSQPSSHQAQPSQSSSYFQHQYPTTPATPASALPPYLNPHVHVPTTYRSATANNLLTDNASVLTLASSSNRQVRRNSLDTNASIRAIAPSSVWGGSRESLPLSVLSQNTNEPPYVSTSATAAGSPGHPPTSSSSHSASTASTAQQPRPHSGVSGLIPAERASVYSSGGVAAPALSSERNSVYAGKEKPGIDGASMKGAQGQDGSSIRSGLGHGRSESITGSIGGLASPKESLVDGEKGF